MSIDSWLTEKYGFNEKDYILYRNTWLDISMILLERLGY